MKNENILFHRLLRHVKKSYLLIPILFLLIIFVESCKQDNSRQETDNQKVAKAVDGFKFTQKDGILTVLMDNSLASYFIYQGAAMGYEYEMLELFANENNLKLEVKIIHQVENILDSLKAGKGDQIGRAHV